MALKFTGIIALFLFSPFILAHPPGLSSADVTIKPDGVSAKITFATQDIEAFVPMDADQDAEVTQAEREAAKTKVVEFVLNETVLILDGQEVKPASPGRAEFDDQNNATVEFQYSGVPASSIGIKSKLLAKLSPDHKEYLTIKSGDNKEIAKKMLTQASPGFEADLKNTEANEMRSSSTFSDFLKLGIEHILTGYDHLLFLFSLLVVTRNFWPALKIITFFTIAHSITLALAGLNIVNAPSSLVEPLIAATIVYVGLENIIRKDKVTTFQRCMLTFFFGLIHGFGFAGVLKEMDISSIETGILVPLFSFNLGVELGQIAVALVVLPLIWRLHKQENIERYLVPVGSVLTCLAGGYWLLERTVLS